MKLPAVVRSTRTELPCSVILGSCSSDVADANGFAYCSQSRLQIILSDLSVAVFPPPPSWARSKFFGRLSERFCFASGQWWCTNALVLLCFVWNCVSQTCWTCHLCGTSVPPWTAVGSARRCPASCVGEDVIVLAMGDVHTPPFLEKGCYCWAVPTCCWLLLSPISPFYRECVSSSPWSVSHQTAAA